MAKRADAITILYLGVYFLFFWHDFTIFVTRRARSQISSPSCFPLAVRTAVGTAALELSGRPVNISLRKAVRGRSVRAAARNDVRTAPL